VKNSFWTSLIIGLFGLSIALIGCSDDAALNTEKDTTSSDTSDTSDENDTDPTNTDPADTSPGDTGTGPADTGTGSKDTGSDTTPQAVVLDTDHIGWRGNTGSSWQYKNCLIGGCHATSDAGYPHDSSWVVPLCQTCHGGNGACETPSDHTKSDSCASSDTSCHGGGLHGFNVASDCVDCHMPDVGGTRICP